MLFPFLLGEDERWCHIDPAKFQNLILYLEA